MAPQISRTLSFALVLALLCGCAPRPEEASEPPAPEPDCSFRAATSCWTLGARFPERRSEPTDSQPGQILKPPAAVLATETDSTPRNNIDFQADHGH